MVKKKKKNMKMFLKLWQKMENKPKIVKHSTLMPLSRLLAALKAFTKKRASPLSSSPSFSEGLHVGVLSSTSWLSSQQQGGILIPAPLL